MSPNAPMLAAGLGLVMLSLVGLLVVLRRTRRVPEPAPAAVDLSPYTVAEAPVPHVSAANEQEPLTDVRALRAQVRVLEEALQRASESTVEQPDLGSYRAQARIAVEAVARRTTADADPRLVVSRVAAALARLDAEPSARVALPTPPRRHVAVAPVATELEPRPEPRPEPQPEPEVRAEAEPAEPAAPVVAADEVVLPVPPPAPAEPRRHKRRSRRSAA